MKKYYKYTLIAIVLLIGFTLFYKKNFGVKKLSEVYLPKISRGVLDLSTWDFEENGLVEVKGEWEFFWKQVLSPEDFQADHRPYPTGFFNYGPWKKKKVKDYKLPEFGYATYRTLIKLPDPERQYGIRIPEALSAYKMYVNGRVVAQAGVVGESKEKEVPAGYNNFTYFIPNSRVIEILFQISNFSYRDRGQNRTIEFGLKEQVEDKRLNAILLDAFVVGSIMIMGVYHVGLFFIRRKKMSPLFFGIFCLVMAPRTLAVGSGDLIYIISKTTLFKVEKFLEFFGFFIGAASFGHLTFALFPRQTWKWNHVIAWTFAGLFSIGFLFLPTVNYPPLVRVFHPVALLVIIMAIAGVVRALRQGKDGSLLYLVGLLIISGGAINDILVARKIINGIILSHFGLFLYIFIQALLLFRMFSEAFTQVEVSEKQIRKMNLELVEKEKARTLFFHNTSHELRTPLNGIIGYIELLKLGRYGKLNAQAKKQLAKVEDLAKGLKNQVNTILDLAKSKKGELKLSNSLITLDEIVEEARILAGGLVLKESGLDFKINKTWSNNVAPRYINDREKLLTIIRNLIGNAFKFKDPNRPNNVVFDIKDNKSGIQVSVSDTGIGIPADQVGRIFEEFEQVERDASRSYEGTGLGLAMVKNIIHLMNGDVKVDSQVGKGTTFIVNLPSQDEVSLTQVEEIPEPQVHVEEHIDDKTEVKDEHEDELHPEELSKENLSAEKPYNILVVDDNEVNVEVISEVLRLHGYPVDTAYGGREALDKIRRERPDLVILDLMMPEVSGEDVLKDVRGDEALKDLPIILLTARASHEDRIVGLNMGADDYLAKPIITDEILLRVKNILHRIDLAREKSSKEVVERQNEVISSLLELGTRMQFIDHLGEFLDGVLDKLKELFHGRCFAIIIEEPRADIISHLAIKDMGEKDKELLIDYHPYIVAHKSDANDKARGKYIDKEVLGYDSEGIKKLFNETDENIGWMMLGGKIVGSDKKEEHSHTLKLFIKGKPLSVAELNTLKVFIDQVIGASRNRILTARLDKMAHTDSLTGAYNRAFFIPALENEIKHFRDTNSKMNFSILMCDVNGLKRINDECGHEEGDALICKCYNVLKKASRETDVVVRQGGDEFVVLCPNTTINEAGTLLNRIRELEEKTYIMYKTQKTGAEFKIPVHMSIGIASSEEMSPDDVLKEADQRMYKDKEEYYKTNARYDRDKKVA